MQSFSSIRQRGIFSEVINPENASQFGAEIQQGPSERYVLHQNKRQKIPRAISLNQEVQEQFQFKAQTDIITVDPKVMEPNDPIPGRVPRKVAIDRKKKEYASFDLNVLMSQVNQSQHWLPLELFDDITYDDFSNEEWLERAKEEKSLHHALTAKGLILNENTNKQEWKCILITDYDKKTQLFSAVMQNPKNQRWNFNNQINITRINFCLDAEDPRKFMKRVERAYKERMYYDSLIRYNYYIDNMPMQDLNELDSEQKKRLENLCKTKKLEQEEMSGLIQEVNNDYTRTMNKIIFDKYLEDNENESMFPEPLNLPKNDIEVVTSYYGMQQISSLKKEAYMTNYKEINYGENKDFTDIFQDFCFASLYIKEEVIKALQDINIQCNEISQSHMFHLHDLPQIMRLEEFKHIQDSATSQILYTLKGTWVNDLIKIIKLQFQSVGKGWFNMKETSKVTYDFGKLKRFLTVVRLVMQDTLLSLVQKSYYSFYDFITSFIPQKVTIHDSNKVENVFKTYKRPLFTIELFKTLNDDAFVFNTNPQQFITVLLQIFDKGLEEISKIPDLEPKILSDLYKSQKNELFIKAPMKPRDPPLEPTSWRQVPDENKWIQDLHDKLKQDLTLAIVPLQEYIQKFDKFKDVLFLKPEDYVLSLEIAEIPIEPHEIQEQIYAYQKKEQILKQEIPLEIHVSCFKIQCNELYNYLIEKFQTVQKSLIQLIAKRCRESTTQIFNSFETIKSRLKETPTDIEKLTELKEYMANLPNELLKVQVEIAKTTNIYGILESFNYKFTKEEMNKKWLIIGGPKETTNLMEQRKKTLDKDQVKFLDQMKAQQEEFKSTIDNLERTIQNFHQHQKLENHNDISQDVASVNEQLVRYMEDAKKFNMQEGLFDMPQQTDYSKLNIMIKEFQPYSNLWLAANKWFNDNPKWIHGPFDQLDAPAAEKFVEDSVKTLTVVLKYFKDRDIEAMSKITQTVKQQLDQFKPKVPLMVALRKEGMKDRHWEQISEKVGFLVQPAGEDFCFNDILEMGLQAHSAICCDIGERAEKEFNIENMLNQMFGIWEKINFELPSYKDTTHIIRGADKIQEILDEHIINTQAMQFSPFKKPFEEQIISWNEQLKLMSDVLEEWMKCQSQWMYLQPIFDSPDIAKQLPQETKKFKTVDTTWRHTMQQAKNIQNVLQVCTGEGLLERLQEANKNLELIQKELNNYLEKKREKFARFYLLSNDDLLEILSQTKEPTAVQPYLKIIFEAIQRIEFDEKKKITAMFSAEKERVSFVKPVDPNNKNVEDWMGELEEMMRISVRQVLLQSIQNYPRPNRCEWILNNAGQAVLNGSQVHWTQEVETAIKTCTMQPYLMKCQQQLFDMVDLVRTPISENQMITLNGLIVIDVHAKDVVQMLVDQNISDIFSFEWISQLRYYWENDDCYCKNIQTNYPYGYEYLGNSLRLVITPLTDKCYMTLMGALKIHLGGAPAGPAGTGKTETTKDLAKALAKQCMVFNCSDSMDYQFVAKLFKGLASSGAWACFDEFNRINIEVLSVIGQQLLQLFTEKSKGTPRILFEDSDIKLSPNFCVFITMNPGYAGRTELPDNLKALFRSVAMMVPDYALIGEIMLYSFGFMDGRILAKKMVFTFKLCSEQLSSQSHYDYGMRAVRSVINAAGLLKRATPDIPEEKLMLRALRDVNMPKFLKDDLPLFENIIKDLFPGVEKPQPNYGGLVAQLNKSCAELNLEPTAPFIEKVMQLYDTIQVRHGLMLVGPTGGGKTSNYQVLQHALTKLQNEGFYKVHTDKLNPKSIKMGQLYGDFTEATHEWTDGILAFIIRETVKDLSGDKHWIVFDGPVDAIWIENMNTVLDDNKKLCLNSGQILTLTPHMTMMFEVEDLEVASPATVSRCGMVYMEPGALGMQPIIDSWLSRIFPNLKKIKPRLTQLFNSHINNFRNFVRTNVIELQPTKDNNLVQSLTHILDCFFENFRENEAKKISNEEIDNLLKDIESMFMFAAIWSFGCTGQTDVRMMFNDHIRSITKVFPEDGCVQDYFFDTTERKFTPWNVLFNDFEIQSTQQYHEIMIPNIDSVRNSYLSTMLIKQGYHVLCPGPTGTGKSMNIYALLNQIGETYQFISITFSAQTSENQTQDTIDSKMDKRRRGYYGPPVGKKCIIFIDDLNMPKKETYGAQPPIEILRQYMDHKGWYNRKDLQFMFIEDTTVLSAMKPPGGGASQITARFIRHFNVIAYVEMSSPVVQEIFNRMTKHFLKKFPEAITKYIETLTESVLKIYTTVKQELLPTPKKSHYTFNLRDIWKLFQGICSASQRFTQETVDIVRLFYHESNRVFYDRLTDRNDQKYFDDIVCETFKAFKLTKEDVIDQDRVIFADFLFGRDADPRQYCQVKDLPQLLYKMESFQDDYNADPQYVGGNKKQMKLVMFLDACEHISRISRIIRQPQGNALILGVGGSGRQSLSKMASFIMNYKIFQIEVVKNYNMRAWREDIKKCLMQAGVDNKPISFLFVDTQIINEQMLEDINNILNSGDVTNIYQEKDFEEIQQACKSDCIKKNMQPNKMNIFSCYIQRVKRNVHMIICMSQLSATFAQRLRQFPSLVNCCTLDWFSEWPEEALIGVGKGSIQESEQELGIEDHEIQRKLVNMFKNIHKSVETYSVQFYDQLRRYTYVTPTSYLELLSIYKQILQSKRQELTRQVERLKGGLDKLNGANIAVEEMKVDLTDMQPKLEKASIETQQMMESLSIDKQEASVQQKQVSQEEKEATAQAEEANKLAKEAEMAVQDANDSLAKTLDEVKKLKKEHLVEIKSFTNPSDVIVIVLQAVIILVIDKIKDKGGDIQYKIINGKKEEDFFGTAKLFLLNDPKDLLDILMKYEKDNIQEKQIKRLEAGPLQNPKWSIEAAQKSSYAVQFLFSWVKAMSDYYKVYTTTQPLREKLISMKNIVEQKTKELLQKKEALDKVNARIQELENQFNEKIMQKEQLTSKINECQLKLDRAQKLTEGLSDEKVRWGNDIDSLSKSFEYLPGDSLIAAGMVSYSGCFTANFRSDMENSWIKMLVDLQISFNNGIRMINYLGEPVKIQTWNIAGLPKNDTSIENGIIIDKSRRWPLMIDPQNQANKFIKNMGKDQPEGIDQIKASDQNLMRTLELAIQFGKWVLLENVGQNLDPSLEPILQQQVIKSGSSMSIAIGDKNIPYNEKFKFYMTTTLPNPHYSPETSVKVTIINFAITPQGLEDQMLAILVGLENPNLEQKKIEIVRKNASDKKELFNIEDSILKSLSEQKGDISELLMDETLINKLQSSKKFAAEINQRLKDSKVTEELINNSRESYRSVAFRASILFFCINDISGIDHMYQYSLQWFTQLFEAGVENAAASTQLETRLQNLNDYFTYSLYQNVCRSLFESHKLLFSTLLTHRILQGYNKIDPVQWRFLLTGASGEVTIPETKLDWIQDNQWPNFYRQINGISKSIQIYNNFENIIMENSAEYKVIFDSQTPHTEPLPHYGDTVSEFEKMLVLNIIRPDKVIPAVQSWISNSIGQQYILSPSFELGKCFKDSNQMTPLLIILSAGSDPVTDFLKFAEEQQKSTSVISLGQGQGPRAEKMIKEQQARGGWVLLQNCHLCVSWLPELERIVEELNDNIHRDFRLWLTSMPSSDFPISILQNGVKMTMEPPKGLRNNLLRTYNSLNDKELNDCKKPEIFKKLLFSLCLFHAIILDRRKFGPIGWNIQYDFTNEDLFVSKKQIKMLLDEYQMVPYKVMNFLISEINYGGRVTDDKDVKLIKTIVSSYINPQALDDGHKFSKSGLYIQPIAFSQQEFIKYISDLPLIPLPEAFGLHDNADITNAQNETVTLLDTILSIEPKSSSGGSKSREEVISDIAINCQKTCPPVYSEQMIMEKFPVSYSESMNTVLFQEVVKYNRLLTVMVSSLSDIQKALKGRIVMSDELEKMANSLFDNQVPANWSEKGFLSLKPLAAWTSELTLRIKFIDDWIQHGTPKHYWIPGFFFPQAFFTGISQNFARKYTISIDKITFDMLVRDDLEINEETQRPDDGCIVHGMFLEGARWDSNKHIVTHSKPKELFTDFPVMHLMPVSERVAPTENIIECPIYKVVSRKGTLMTTGHSTNFVMYIELATKEHKDVWVRAGVAGFISLKY